jgi:hypothetical protein
MMAFMISKVPPDHLLLDSAPNLGSLLGNWHAENCCPKSVGILEVLKLLFRQFLNMSGFQWDMSGAILGNLSNKRWSGGTWKNRACSLSGSCTPWYSSDCL